MSDRASTWWLRGDGGVASRVTPGGLLLGRSPHSDLVLRSERASRRHALVYLADVGPELLLLGRGAVSVGGAAVDGQAALSEGDRIELPGLALEVVREAGAVPRPAAGSAVWLFEGPGGGLYGMSRSPFLVGGDAEDDLRVEPWPPAALSFETRPTGLFVEASVSIKVDGQDVDGGEMVGLRVGSIVEHAEARIKVVTGGELASGSTVAAEPGGVTKARLEFLPRGGRLHVTVEGVEHSVYLTDRRCDLIAVLLQPPEPWVAGDLIDDDQILGRVWGTKKRVDRTHLNVLLHRVRKDLARAELDGARILERAEGGGATRFALSPDATVELE